MITEDYASFEVAKLLKEKGFDERCNHYYFYKELKELNYYERNSDDLYLEETEYCTAPTHQMAMKWLREKGVHMSIDTVISLDENIYFNIDVYSEASGWCNPVNFYDSYEDAVEVALKYALENLI